VAYSGDVKRGYLMQDIPGVWVSCSASPCHHIFSGKGSHLHCLRDAPVTCTSVARQSF